MLTPEPGAKLIKTVDSITAELKNSLQEKVNLAEEESKAKLKLQKSQHPVESQSLSLTVRRENVIVDIFIGQRSWHLL